MQCAVAGAQDTLEETHQAGWMQPARWFERWPKYTMRWVELGCRVEGVSDGENELGMSLNEVWAKVDYVTDELRGGE